MLPATLDANHSIHPARKLAGLPKPILAKLYAPPALGIAELSSAKDIAVNIASKPLRAKVSTTPPGLGFAYGDAHPEENACSDHHSQAHHRNVE